MNKLCEKCGLPLGFRKLPSGKWCPANPDLSDHWDLCRETRLAAMSPEERAVIDALDAAARKPITMIGKRVTHTYRGTVPPWDESLGPFREFTAADKAVMRPVTKRTRRLKLKDKAA